MNLIAPTPKYLANTSSVAIWGASESGEECMHQLDSLKIKTVFFIDRNVPQSGRFHNIPVYSFVDAIPLLEKVNLVFLAMGVDPSAPIGMLRDEAAFNKPILKYRAGGDVAKILMGQLCLNHLFNYQGGVSEIELLAKIKSYLQRSERISIYGAGQLTNYLLSCFPELSSSIEMIVEDDQAKEKAFPVIQQDSINNQTLSPGMIFLSSTRYLTLEKMKRRVRKKWGESVEIITLNEIVAEIDEDAIPVNTWRDPEYSIYPINIPPIEIKPSQDLVLLDLPARFLGMMPNGLGYVHNILKKCDIEFQTLDMDLILYHRYHSKRILDGLDEVKTKTGYVMRKEPWAIDVVSDEWSNPEVIEYFRDDIDGLVEELVNANPRMLALSLHSTNILIAKEVVQRVRQARPEMIVIVGGYDCIRPVQGPNIFSDFDYMVIFEAETSLEPLIRKLMAGERPRNMPGVISRFDEPSFPFVPAQLVEDLDSIEFPRYDWVDDISVYQNYHGYQLTPIVLTRGCRWSRCTFCGERFHWRKRSASNMVDEIEWLASKGCTLFHFNDSDLSGDPETVRQVCEEIIRRKLDGLNFVGQLRVQKGYTQEYFHVLKKAGFKRLRYGIDGWSKNTLKLHKKGYTLGMIDEVIRFTKNAGIGVTINLVIGIPYETEKDIDETIENMIRNKSYFDQIENINTLMLFAGSIYWEQPEKFGIRFVGEREALYKKYPKVMPVDYWYSEEPFIDQAVRQSRLQKIVDVARFEGIPIGGFAKQRVKSLGIK